MYTFIYLEKAFGRVQGPYKVCGIVVGFGKGVTLKYMKLLKDMYYKAITMEGMYKERYVQRVHAISS